MTSVAIPEDFKDNHFTISFDIPKESLDAVLKILYRPFDYDDEEGWSDVVGEFREITNIKVNVPDKTLPRTLKRKKKGLKRN